MYYIYLRDKNQKIYRKFTTDNKEEAIKYFEEVIYRKELYGRKLIVIFQFKDSIKEFHRFDASMHLNQLQEKIQKIKKRSVIWQSQDNKYPVTALPRFLLLLGQGNMASASVYCIRALSKKLGEKIEHTFGSERPEVRNDLQVLLQTTLEFGSVQMRECDGKDYSI